MPPPVAAAGIAGWCRDRLFSSPLNIVLTVLVAWLLFMTLPALIDWLFRSEEHTSELQSLMRISYAVFFLKKKSKHIHIHHSITILKKNIKNQQYIKKNNTNKQYSKYQ